MSDTTEIEKKSLEAHVELCAERYRFLEEKLEDMDAKISKLNSMMGELSDTLGSFVNRRQDQIINWAGGLIAGLIGIVGYLLVNFVIK